MLRKLLHVRSLGASACLVSSLLTSGAQGADAIVPPHVRSQSAPTWPANAPADRDIDVVVVVTVAADGSVLDAHVDDSLGADYDLAAIDAVKHWQFEPATRNGRAIPARVRALVHFAPGASAAAALPAPEPAKTRAPLVKPAAKSDPVVPDSASKRPRRILTARAKSRSPDELVRPLAALPTTR